MSRQTYFLASPRYYDDDDSEPYVRRYHRSVTGRRVPFCNSSYGEQFRFLTDEPGSPVCSSYKLTDPKLINALRKANQKLMESRNRHHLQWMENWRSIYRHDSCVIAVRRKAEKRDRLLNEEVKRQRILHVRVVADIFHVVFYIRALFYEKKTGRKRLCLILLLKLGNWDVLRRLGAKMKRNFTPIVSSAV